MSGAISIGELTGGVVAYARGKSDPSFLKRLTCTFSVRLQDEPEFLARVSAVDFLEVFSLGLEEIDWEKTMQVVNQPHDALSRDRALPVYAAKGEVCFDLWYVQHEGGWLWAGVIVRNKALLEKWKITGDDMAYP